MIVYDLRCAGGHCFEAWFRSAAAYDEQAAAHAVTCPLCGDDQIAKAPMAPFVARGARDDRNPPPAPHPAANAATQASADAATQASADAATQASAEMVTHASAETALALRAVMNHLRRHIEERCVDVGRAFPEVSRRIHYGEVEAHGIYGEASADDARSLREEGIEVVPLPWFHRRND
jgi:hypothetical protein